MKFKVVQKVDWRHYDLNGRLTRKEGKYLVRRNGLISRFYLNAFLRLSGNIVHGGSIDNPCFTLIARMDKMPPYLITTEEGLGIEVYETDSPMTVKVKEFMAMYGIIDIYMRMLNVGELKRIMGFPSDYVLVGTQAEQKKYIGNAVEVNMARVLCEALISEGGVNEVK